MNNEWQSFGRNIRVIPKDKNKIIGETSKYFLYGDVVSVGDEVKKIKIGDQIAYTLFGINEVLLENGEKHYLIQESDDFILEVLRKDIIKKWWKLW
jgi:hypothetical protein